MQEGELRHARKPASERKEGGEPGKDAVVTVELETLSEVPEAKIDKLKLERLTVEADDAAVDKALVDLAQGQKSFDPAKPAHKAGKGALVLMDFEGNERKSTRLNSSH